MLVEKKSCECCEKLYDKRLEFCPYCKKENAEKDSFGYKDKACWVPMLYQFLYAIIGSLGLSSASFLVSLIAVFAFPDTLKIPQLAFVNFVSYAIVLIALVCTSIPNFKFFASHLKKWKPYLIGLAGAVILVCFQLFYEWFINLFYHMEDSENQKIATELVKSFPVASVFFLGIIGPVVEEITYRVGMFSLAKRVSRVLAYVITPLIFGLIHFDISNVKIVNEFINLPIYIICGLSLSFLYDKFGLGASISAHIGNNLYSVISIIILHSMGKI